MERAMSDGSNQGHNLANGFDVASFIGASHFSLAIGWQLAK